MVVTGLATLDPLLLCCIILVLFHCRMAGIQFIMPVAMAGIQYIMPVSIATNNW